MRQNCERRYIGPLSATKPLISLPKLQGSFHYPIATLCSTYFRIFLSRQKVSALRTDSSPRKKPVWIPTRTFEGDRGGGSLSQIKLNFSIDSFCMYTPSNTRYKNRVLCMLPGMQNSFQFYCHWFRALSSFSGQGFVASISDIPLCLTWLGML